MLGAIVDKDQWRTHRWKDTDYLKRIPNVLWNKCYQLENKLLALNKNKNIKASVIAVGTIYGKQNQGLQTDILRALEGQQLTIHGSGINQVPLLHIDTFLEGIKELESSHQQYNVLRDTKSFNQKIVKTTIAQGKLFTIQFQEVPLLFSSRNCYMPLKKNVFGVSNQSFSAAAYLKTLLLIDS